VILDVAGKTVDNPFEVRDAVEHARSAGKQLVLMRIKSGDTARYIAVPLAAG
jgi:serine protease Do